MNGNSIILTEHFIRRQSERNVPCQLIENIANRIVRSKRKTMVIISRKILKPYGIKMNKDLFLITDGPVLITCYYRDFQEFILTSNKQVDCLIINTISN